MSERVLACMKFQGGGLGGKVTWTWTLASGLGQGLKVMVWAIFLGKTIFFISIVPAWSSELKY